MGVRTYGQMGSVDPPGKTVVQPSVFVQRVVEPVVAPVVKCKHRVLRASALRPAAKPRRLLGNQIVHRKTCLPNGTGV